MHPNRKREVFGGRRPSCEAVYLCCSQSKDTHASTSLEKSRFPSVQYSVKFQIDKAGGIRKFVNSIQDSSESRCHQKGGQPRNEEEKSKCMHNLHTWVQSDGDVICPYCKKFKKLLPVSVLRGVRAFRWSWGYGRCPYPQYHQHDYTTQQTDQRKVSHHSPFPSAWYHSA